ncbi:probable galactinol--sucrose galactosyltransferase 2 [Andrographis paniculata]|uniref:probable galactinol--sucrose galactosyltransferase 2 n=1 Tax=Andrographis paniculata TaxID=175694 RepID=UPI0021E7B717|nr:probable galactinol--sucrose galactosyltransferase 2 [Andrographis paniculata]
MASLTSCIYISSTKPSPNFLNLFLTKSKHTFRSPHSPLHFRTLIPRSIFRCSSKIPKLPKSKPRIFDNIDKHHHHNRVRTRNIVGGEAKMTVTAAVQDGTLIVNGKAVVVGVPSNIVVRQVFDDLPAAAAAAAAAFIGAASTSPSSRHVFRLGHFQECKYVSLFRHKIWWMIPRFGSLGKDIPIETQMLLLEETDPAGDTFYVLLLPVLEGKFRATLQGNSSNELELCVESGDEQIETMEVTESVLINSGRNPFELIKDSFKILEKCKGTFTNLVNKKKPAHLDWFGWCTWDAFYKDVNPVGIKEGLESFLEGGCPPKFLIIDDGWQDTCNEFHKEGEPLIEGTQFASRLVDIKESAKFMASGVDISCYNLRDLVNYIKEEYSVKFIYVWHALLGYWGGLLPSSEKMKKYNPKIIHPLQSPGNIGNIRDIAMDSIEKYGVGLIDPEKAYDFYNDLHSYLSSCNVDGVKVDVQNLAETLGNGYGGRVTVTQRFQGALEESIAKNFEENNLISCMSLNNDYVYSSKKSATARASEDFMPREPSFQTLHVASVAFNSLLLGEVSVPDWDMFQSNHYTAEFHGAARALGGCPVYVSDKPGKHDFKVLKKLVLPDGSILRARYAGRPTRDCLFVDTVVDGKSLLKIWNLNKFSGVIGVFNCQGAGNWPMMDDPAHYANSSSEPRVLSSQLSPEDIDFLEEVTDESCDGECAAYAFHTGSLSRLSKEERIKVSLATLECEVFTVSPIRVLNEDLQFAPIGLIDMYNSGGAVQGLRLSQKASEQSVIIEARGSGRLGAYSSKKPVRCTVDGEEFEFVYFSDNGLLIVNLEGECKVRDISYCY